jgi:hypothetical protein
MLTVPGGDRPMSDHFTHAARSDGPTDPDDYAEAEPSGMDDFPGAWLETAFMVLVWLGGLTASVLIDRGLLH